MIAAGYIRVSVSHDDGVSPDIQRTAIEEYAVRKGWSIAEFFQDLDISGRTDKRPGLQEMLRRAQDGEFEAVIFYRVDRLSREPMHHYAILAALAEAGVQVDSVGLPREDTPESAFMWDLSAALAKLESLRHGKRIRDSHRTLRSKGRFAGGRPPYGMRHQSSGPGLEPDPTEAPWVVQMHEWFQRRWSITRIARELNARGVLTRSGSQWLASTVLRTLARPTLAGGRLDGSELVCGGNIHPIISPECWRRTQALMRGNHERFRAGKASRGAIPSRLVRCGTCGRGLRVRYRDGHLMSLACWARGDGACERGVSIYGHVLERVIQERLIAKLRRMRAEPPPAPEPGDAIDTAEREVAAQQTALERLALAYADGAMEMSEYQAARRRLVGRLDQAQKRLDQQQSRVENSVVREGVRALWGDLERLAQHPELLRAMPEEQRRDLYTLLIERVVVRPQGEQPRVEVRFRF